MRQKPFYYLFLTCYLAMMVFTFPFQIVFFKDLSWPHAYQSFFEFHPLLLGIILTSLMAAYFSWTVDKKLNLSVGLLALLVLSNCFFLSNKDQTILKTLAGSLLYLAPFVFMLVPEYQEALQNRKRHWWRSARRINKKIPVNVEMAMDKGQSKVLPAQTINISKTGALLLVKPSELEAFKDLIHELKEKESSLKIKTSDNEFESKAEIIRLKRLKESENFQVAVTFCEIDAKNRRKLYSQILNH